jgi:hypothetical protein
LIEITIPKVKPALQKVAFRHARINGEKFYLMSPVASTAVRIDMNASPMMKMESAIFS